ncbi:hypothetical protein ACTWLI_12960 [Arthrobacter sp. Hor0625]|uniref:hypothetical protein n=1 Tax=Arthrobacter sp. Hor0625 TaxID=3457358 RepID=UPI00403E6DB3
MKTTHTGRFLTLSAAGLAAGLVLSGCGGQPGGPAASEAAASAVTVSGVTTVAGQRTQPSDSPRDLKTFTFPDGHISFSYPETWTVRTQYPPAGLPGVEAVVADEAGREVVSLANGVGSGCAGGPASRHVLDRAAVPAMTGPDGTVPAFGFAVESIAGKDYYNMGLADPRSLEQGDGVTSWCNLVPTENGGLFTRVHFGEPAFANRGEARAWMATERYAQLKALLVSLAYA